MSGSKVDIGVRLINEAQAETRQVRAELERAREDIAELVKSFERACQTVYDEIEPTCGHAIAQQAYHAVKTELRAALAKHARAETFHGD